MTYNEESTINNVLATVLRDGNPRWRSDRGSVEAEQLQALDDGGKPDILLLDRGAAPVILETEFHPARTVEADARQRLGKQAVQAHQSIEQAVAIRVPASLREVAQNNLPEAVRQTKLEYCLLSLGLDESDPVTRLPSHGWLAGDVSDLATLLENASLSERLVSSCLVILEQAVLNASTMLRFTSDQQVTDRIASVLYQEPSEQTDRMAMTIVANALIFQTSIAPDFDEVQQPSAITDPAGNVSQQGIIKVWDHILLNINYWPIFVIARNILNEVPNKVAAKILETLSEAAQALDASGVARSHDITGRMFQRLISDRKFLATYYTRPESARFLAELAVDMLPTDWSSADAITGLRIGDLACGTGTLISAAYHSINTRYRRRNRDDHELHRPMIQDSLVAADIMPNATHLTTAMLSSVHPSITFQGTQVFTLPYGRSENTGVQPLRLGALDLIEEQDGVDLLGSTGIQRLHGAQDAADDSTRTFSLAHETLDLVIMNPPFVRPTGHEAEKIGVPVPAFAGLGNSKAEQRKMSARLKQIRGRLRKPAGHGNAGLASNFIDLAHAKIRTGGTLALVLPVTLANGDSWEASRALLNTYYEDISLITISTPRAIDMSFSADTNMGEVLVIARRRKQPNKDPDVPVRWISLVRRPIAVSEATEVARLLRGIKTDGGHRCGEVNLGEDHVGCYVIAPIRYGGCAALSDPALAQMMLDLEQGTLNLPRYGSELLVPITKLEALGEPGVYHMDLTGKGDRGPFTLQELRGEATYPTLWNHDAPRERHLVVEPCQQLDVKDGMIDKANEVWKSARCLHLNRDFTLNAQSLAACMTEQPSLGGTAWPNYILNDTSHERVITLWANTTLGLMSFWWEGTRQHPGRARISITSLANMLTIDSRTLQADQLRLADDIFAEYSTHEFLAAHRAAEDESRIALDRAILVDLLGLPADVMDALSVLRKKWCAEPSVHAGKRK